MKKKIYLIDGNNFIYRMFFWLPEFSTKDGRIVNATFWMAKFFTNQLVKEKPDYVFFVKDSKAPNFRMEIYEEYKATRERMPDNLRSQISDIEMIIDEMWIPTIWAEWYEADDVIGTLATQLWQDQNNEVFVLTGDKDLYSLVKENVKIYDTMKKKISGPDETREKFWIEPEMIIDYLAIVWDTADNIPGIAGFWPKKAVTMINEIWWVEKVYEVLDSGNFDNLSDDAKKIYKWKALEKLSENRENAFLSKKLATVCLEAPLGENFDLQNYKFFPDNLFSQKVIEIFKDFEFNSLIPESAQEEKKTWKDANITPKIIWDEEELQKLKNLIKKQDKIVLDTETTALSIIDAQLVWISIYIDDDNTYYINRKHRWPAVGDKTLHNFIDFLLSSDILIIGHNIKYDLQILELFMKHHNNHDWEENSQESQNIQWQMSLL